MKRLALPAVVIGLLLQAPSAQARCDTLLRGLEHVSADRLVARYKKVIECDKQVANQTFPQFMTSADDAETLVALSLSAIQADIWHPVWEMVGQISSYEARDEVASRVGQSCESNPKVVGFLQGAYFGLRGIEFSQWDDALVSCTSSDLQDWMVSQVEQPPPKLYDEKWSALADALVQRMGPDALPHLAKGAAVAAEKGGPFEAILMKMEAAVAPDLGEEMKEEHRQALEQALVNMAADLPPEQARSVADRLANSGSDARAAELLPVVYPDRKKGEYYIYGGASIEAGTCKGEKEAMLHFTELREPGKRWIVYADAEEPLRQFKARLRKCEDVGEPWPVVVSPEPLESSSDLSDWADEIARKWEEKGYAVKTRSERPIELK